MSANQWKTFLHGLAISMHQHTRFGAAVLTMLRPHIISTYRPAIPDPRDNNTYDGFEVIKAIGTAAQNGVGAAKYGIGFKGGWSVCRSCEKGLMKNNVYCMWDWK